MWGGQNAITAEAYRPGAIRQPSSALLVLPGARTRQPVSYDVVDGMAVLGGDILLGPADTVMLRYGLPFGGFAQGPSYAVAIQGEHYRWPGGQVPYVIDPSVGGASIESIQWAVAQANQTELTFRPRGPGDSDYVVFRDDGSGCNSYVGRIGGAQQISTTGCGKGSILHEMLHAAGLFHEQSRGDRDDYITIHWNEISPGNSGAFEKHDSSDDIGPYDYGSIMHYSRGAFSRSGNPTIVPKMPNVTIGQREGLSAGDRAAITVLYGAAGGASPIPGATIPPGAPPTQVPAQGGGFAGDYTSNQGNVMCSQAGSAVTCQFTGGMLWCAASGENLSCAWSGALGQGRAAFQRRADGVLAGAWGDAFSTDSRGGWELVPVSGAAPGAAPPPAQSGWPILFPIQLPSGFPAVFPTELPPGFPNPFGVPQ